MRGDPALRLGPEFFSFAGFRGGQQTVDVYLVTKHITPWPLSVAFVSSSCS